MISAEVIIRVQFYHLDPMFVVWHGNYPEFLEQARTAMFENIAFGYSEMDETGYIWPVVDMRIKYVRPLVLGQRIKVKAELAEFENRIKVSYLITDLASGTTLTKAHTIQVAVDRNTQELSFETPAALIEKIRRAL
jgi:acyl-CoA thioester hydrolase